jgi:hypothetical protein
MVTVPYLGWCALLVPEMLEPQTELLRGAVAKVGRAVAAAVHAGQVQLHSRCFQVEDRAGLNRSVSI